MKDGLFSHMEYYKDSEGREQARYVYFPPEEELEPIRKAWYLSTGGIEESWPKFHSESVWSGTVLISRPVKEYTAAERQAMCLPCEYGRGYFFRYLRRIKIFFRDLKDFFYIRRYWKAINSQR